MRRVFAALTALSVCVLQSQAGAFHVHAAPEHGDDDHHHGPAIHHHEDVDRERHVEGEEPADGRIITIAVPAGTVSATAAALIELISVLPAPERQVIASVRAIELRSHGPPLHEQQLLRGPPSTTLL